MSNTDLQDTDLGGADRQCRALEREVHVWWARPDAVPDPSILERCRAVLCEHEIARMERLRSDALRRLFLVSHALVRTSLSRYADVPAESWRFSTGEHGRPEVAHPPIEPRLRFNLSHTAGLAACVVCLEWDCGVDVERVGRVKNMQAVAGRVLTDFERDDLHAITDEEVLQGRFTDYWALKEAYIKARGLGFQLSPQRFGVRIRGAGEVEVVFGEDLSDQRAADWQLELQRVGEGARLGVALLRGAAPARRIVVRETMPCASG